MLERIDMHEKATSLEKSTDALAAGGIPEEMPKVSFLAGEHYGEVRFGDLSPQYYEFTRHC